VLETFPLPYAPQAVRVTGYGPLFVYSLDEVSVMESGGFWLPGQREASIVVVGRDGSRVDVDLRAEASLPVLLRVARDGWSVERPLRAGVPEIVNVPAGNELDVIRLRAEGGAGRQAVWITLSPR
jgi:hypothetical protein